MSLLFSFVKWVKKQVARPGTKMDSFQKYMQRRDAEKMPVSVAPGMNLPYFHFVCFWILSCNSSELSITMTLLSFKSHFIVEIVCIDDIISMFISLKLL